MPTDLIEILPDDPHAEAIERAAAVIRRGGVVALPSDALYTLVADPYSLKALGKVFDAKGRQPQRSLPLLVTDIMMAEDLVSEMTTRFQKLARKFWPGPLTIIVPAAARVPLRVTGNTGRLGLRQSKSVVASRLLEALGQPLIATSANISGSPTCRTGIECFGVMDRRVDLVLDGGLCVGEGSTTIDITEPYWRIIKEGSISEKDISEVLKTQLG